MAIIYGVAWIVSAVKFYRHYGKMSSFATEFTVLDKLVGAVIIGFLYPAIIIALIISLRIEKLRFLKKKLPSRPR